MSYVTADHLDKNSQKDQGSFYTPQELAIKMAKMLKLKQRQKILDPCVGMGNLFVAVKEVYPFIENEDLYGIDIDPEAIKFCIEKWPGGNFQVGDCLKDDFTDDVFWQKDPFKKYKPSFRSTWGKTK